MANELPQRAAQTAEAARLGESARRVGVRALATSTLIVAQRIAKTAGYSKSVAAGEHAMASIRSDPEFQAALNADLEASTEAVEDAMAEAMRDGVEHEMKHLTQTIKGLRFRFDSSDAMVIRAYPIHGHTVREISRYMHDGLRYEVEGTVAGPIAGDSSSKTTPQDLGAVVQRFGDRIAGAVEEAYFAGLQLAARLAAGAMANAR